MKARISLVATGIVLLGLAALGADWVEEGTAHSLAGLGGKMEHCAMAIGVIGASILSLFNPLTGPAAVGAMSLGLIWMVATCE